MKTTQQAIYNIQTTQLNLSHSLLAKAQYVGTTGKRMNVASDDPTSLRQVFDIRKQISNVDRSVTNLGITHDTMMATDSYLDKAEELLTDAYESVINSINGSYNASDFQSHADSIQSVYDDLLSVANASINGEYVFAGYEVATKPFTANPAYDPDLYDPTNSATWPLTYNGDENSKSIEIYTEDYINVTIPGNELFLGDADNDGQVDSGSIDVFAVLADTIEALNSTPSSTQAMTGSTLAAGTILVAGTELNGTTLAEDTTLTVATVLTADTVILSGSTLATGTDLAMGSTINGDDYSASAANYVLTADEEISSTALVEAQIEDLQAASEQVRVIRSNYGNRTARIDEAITYQQIASVDLQTMLSRYEDADAIEAYNNLIQQETAFMAAMTVTQRISNLSILDYL